MVDFKDMQTSSMAKPINASKSKVSKGKDNNVDKIKNNKNNKCVTTLWAVCLYYARVNICHQHDRHMNMYQPGFEPAIT